MNSKNDLKAVESNEVHAEVAVTNDAPKLVVKTGVRAGARAPKQMQGTKYNGSNHG